MYPEATGTQSSRHKREEACPYSQRKSRSSTSSFTDRQGAPHPLWESVSMCLQDHRGVRFPNPFKEKSSRGGSERNVAELGTLNVFSRPVR